MGVPTSPLYEIATFTNSSVPALQVCIATVENGYDAILKKYRNGVLLGSRRIVLIIGKRRSAAQCSIAEAYFCSTTKLSIQRHIRCYGLLLSVETDDEIIRRVGAHAANEGGVKVNMPSGALAIRGGMFFANQNLLAFIYGDELTYKDNVTGRVSRAFYNGTGIELTAAGPITRPVRPDEYAGFMKAFSGGGTVSQISLH